MNLDPQATETECKRIGREHAEQFDGGGINMAVAFGAMRASYRNLWLECERLKKENAELKRERERA